MLGVRVGVKTGIKLAVAVGVTADDETVGGITDGLSGKGVPTTLADYALLTTKVPSHTWGFQDSSGAIVATVGTNLTVTGTVEYQQAVSGWSRRAVNFTVTANERAAFAIGTGPNPATQSCAWFGYLDFTAAPAGTQLCMAVSDGATLMNARITVTPRMQLNCAGNLGTGTSDPVAGGVRPVLMVYNKTGGTAKLYTDQEVITATFNAGVVDGNKGFGAGGAGTPAQHSVLLGAAFQDANAEFSDSDARSFFQNLGFSVPW